MHVMCCAMWYVGIATVSGVAAIASSVFCTMGRGMPMLKRTLPLRVRPVAAPSFKTTRASCRKNCCGLTLSGRRGTSAFASKNDRYVPCDLM